MKPRYVVDTNVLIAASAVDANSPITLEATPDDPELRLRVWEWLATFQESPSRLVLDGQDQILKEYTNKLGFNDYGREMLVHKYSTSSVDLVDILFDDDGYAYLDGTLATLIHDKSDRKFVAAALAAIDGFGECLIANSGDTDWYDWEDGLRNVGVEVEQIIPEWSRQKWLEKRSGKSP